METSKELSKQSTLVLLHGAEYNEEIKSILKDLGPEKRICYVALNKTSDSLIELFEENKIDLTNVVFIDAISQTFSKVKESTDKTYFVKSPEALTDLSVAINKFLEYKFDVLIFDSLTSLLTYRRKDIVIKFLRSLIDKIKKEKTQSIFYSLCTPKTSDFNNEVSSMVDKAIDLCKKKTF